MKKFTVLFALLCALALCLPALAVTAPSCGTLRALEASPNQRLALRSGPGTDYSEIFSIDAGAVDDFAIYQQEKGGSVMWGMIEFDSRYGRYRVYTGMKRIDTDADAVPTGSPDGVYCSVGAQGARAYYGPGTHYAPVETRLPAWTEIIVFHEEQGYVMADFVLPDAKDDQYDKEKKQLTRAWIPVEALSGYERGEGGWEAWEYEEDEVG